MSGRPGLPELLEPGLALVICGVAAGNRPPISDSCRGC